jgi:hypothetical protein
MCLIDVYVKIFSKEMIKVCKLTNTTLVKNQIITKSCYKFNFLIINHIFFVNLTFKSTK